MHFMYLSLFCLQEPKLSIKRLFFFFLELKTEDTELQHSVAASEVSSWNS